MKTRLRISHPMQYDVLDIATYVELLFARIHEIRRDLFILLFIRRLCLYFYKIVKKEEQIVSGLIHS